MAVRGGGVAHLFTLDASLASGSAHRAAPHRVLTAPGCAWPCLLLYGGPLSNRTTVPLFVLIAVLCRVPARVDLYRLLRRADQQPDVRRGKSETGKIRTGSPLLYFHADTDCGPRLQLPAKPGLSNRGPSFESKLPRDINQRNTVHFLEKECMWWNIVNLHIADSFQTLSEQSIGEAMSTVVCCPIKVSLGDNLYRNILLVSC